ncbi:sugar-binding protein [Salinifilum aidingensis]
MRKWQTLACVLAAVLLVAGCQVKIHERSGAVEPGSGPVKVAVVPKAIGFSFWEKVRVGAECAARGPGVDVHWDGVTEETDVSGQQSLLQDLLVQGDLDGLVYAATDARAMAQVTATAEEQGTQVVNMDSGTTPQPADVPVYATNNVAAAERGTDLLAQQLGGRGKIALVEFQPGTNTNDTRVEGFQRGLRKHLGLELVARQSSESSYNTALQVTQDILTAHPELDGIYAGNEPSVLGAAEAVRQAGRAGDIEIIGWDTSQEQIASLREGVISGLIAQNPFEMGRSAVRAAVDKAHGRTPSRDTDTGSTVITRGNVDAPEVQRLLHPACAKPPE